MANLPHVLMTSDEEWDPSPYTTICTMKEQLISLPLHQKGTCKDTYDQEGNLDFNVITVPQVIAQIKITIGITWEKLSHVRKVSTSV